MANQKQKNINPSTGRASCECARGTKEATTSETAKPEKETKERKKEIRKEGKKERKREKKKEKKGKRKKEREKRKAKGRYWKPTERRVSLGGPTHHYDEGHTQSLVV